MEEIRRIRKERGLTQRGLANASGVDQATISMVESGKRRPHLETLDSLADALGVEVGDFFPKAEAVSLEQWLEDRCGHSYLAMSFDELEQFIKDAEDLEEQLERRQLLREEIDIVVAERIRFPATERRNIGNVPFEEIHTRWIRTLLVSVELRIVSQEEAAREVQELALA